MKSLFRGFAVALAVGACACAAQPAAADVPGAHPGYVHALSDLRYAHWLLRFPAEWNVTEHERRASFDVDRAFRDIRRAGIDDGKDVNAPLPVDANLAHRDRLVRALASIERAHRDIDGPESDPNARGPRDAADRDLYAAVSQVREALHDRRRDGAFGY